MDTDYDGTGNQKKIHGMVTGKKNTPTVLETGVSRHN